MQQVRLQEDKNAGGILPQVLFWDGQQALANHLAASLGAPAPLPFDAAAVTRNGTSALVLWRGADHDLATCLTTGASIPDALSAWKGKAQLLLATFRKNRRTLILAEGEALRLGGTLTLCERLGIPEIPSPPATEEPSALAQALVQLALGQDDSLRQLREELLSSSLPGPDMQIDALLDQVAAQTSQTSQTLSALESQLAKASLRTQEVEADRTRLQDTAQGLGQELEAVKRALQAAQAAGDALTAERDALLQDRALLEDQIRQMDDATTAMAAAAQADAAAAALQIKALDGARARQDQEINARVAETSALQASLAQREAEGQMLLDQIALERSALIAAGQRIADLEGALSDQVSRFADLSRERDSESVLLRAQIEIEQSNIALQTKALQDAAGQISALQAQLAQQATKAKAARAEREAEVKSLRARIAEAQEALATQASAAQSAAAASAKRIADLEAAVTQAETTLAAAQADGAVLQARLAEFETDAGLMRDQIKLDQTDMFSHLNAAQNASHAAALRIAALQGEATSQALVTSALETRVAAADQLIVDISAALEAERKTAAQALRTAEEIQAQLTERAEEIDLLRHQLGLVQDDLSRDLPASQAQTHAAALRIKVLLEESLLKDRAKSLAEATARSIQSEVAKLEAALAEEQTARSQAAATNNRLTEDLADRALEAELLLAQVSLLQDNLTQAVTAAADAQEAAKATVPAAHAEEWDKALSKALAAARHEADLRAKLEQDLDAVKAALQARVLREADLAYNRKLFTQMTVEAKASLDEIARLSGPLRVASFAPAPQQP